MSKEKLDYAELGLICGLECHQQLDTGKLFCRCPCILRDDEPDTRVHRRLKAVASELGKYDEAALREYKKKRTFTYEGYHDTTCEIEFDEHPPMPLNSLALKVALQASELMRAEPVDEVRVMRKAVIDGSNTSGFQRTGLVSLNGTVSTKNGDVRVTSIALEEDAARVIERKDHEVIYRLDRLGIPLIEVTTAPDIKTPLQAKEAALSIGSILRATGLAKRGLGTIRQDVNISIKNGARVELKGCQDLSILDEYVENEVRRQLHLIHVSEELKKRKIKKNDLKNEQVRLEKEFENTRAQIIKTALKNKGVVAGLKLNGFNALIGSKKDGEIRLGKELSAHAKTAGVKGLFHSDELPEYGITKKEVDAVRKKLDCKETDAFVLIADKEENAREALNYVFERAVKALNGPTEETRNPLPGGWTEYARPLPGSARMYPETDVPPVHVTKELLKDVRDNLPLMPEERLKKYVEEWSVPLNLAEELKLSNYAPLFEEIVRKGGNPTTTANLLASELKSAKRSSVKIELFPDEFLEDLALKLSKGRIAKQLTQEVLTKASEEKNFDLTALTKDLGVKELNSAQVDSIIDKVVNKNKALIEKQGPRAIGALMGEAMKESKGSVDGKTLNKKLSEKLKEVMK